MRDENTTFNASSHFEQLSSKYEDLIGVLTGDIGRYTLDNLIPSPAPGSIIHDNACGTGLVTEHLQHVASRTGAHPRVFHATDFVPSVTKVLQGKVSHNGWKNVEIAVMDSQELTFSDEYFDLSITNFGVSFLPHPQKGANHIYRTLKHGGVAIITTWKERRLMDTIAEAQTLIRPDLNPLHKDWAEHWSKDTSLPDLLEKAGFAPSNVKITEKRTDAFVDPFLRNPDLVASAYPAAVDGWTDKEKARLGEEVLRLAKARDPKGGGAGGIYYVAYIAVATK